MIEKYKKDVVRSFEDANLKKMLTSFDTKRRIPTEKIVKNTPGLPPKIKVSNYQNFKIEVQNLEENPNPVIKNPEVEYHPELKNKEIIPISKKLLTPPKNQTNLLKIPLPLEVIISGVEGYVDPAQKINDISMVVDGSSVSSQSKRLDFTLIMDKDRKTPFPIAMPVLESQKSSKLNLTVNEDFKNPSELSLGDYELEEEKLDLSAERKDFYEDDQPVLIEFGEEVLFRNSRIKKTVEDEEDCDDEKP